MKSLLLLLSAIALSPSHFAHSQELSGSPVGCGKDLDSLAVISLVDLIRRDYLCGDPIPQCRGPIDVSYLDAEWLVYLCPIFEDSHVLRVDPAPSNTATSSLLVSMADGKVAGVFKEEPQDFSINAMKAFLEALPAQELDELVREFEAGDVP